MEVVRCFGVVKAVKGATSRPCYGFIKRGPGEADLFFHFSDCADREKGFPVGTRVEFTVGVGREGRPAATEVVALPAEEAADVQA